MTKIVFLALLGCVLWRLVMGRWPWQASPRSQARFAKARARALLGVEAGAGRKDILEAHRRYVATVHPDRGGSKEKVHEANAARDVLLAELPQDRPPTL